MSDESCDRLRSSASLLPSIRQQDFVYGPQASHHVQAISEIAGQESISDQSRSGLSYGMQHFVLWRCSQRTVVQFGHGWYE